MVASTTLGINVLFLLALQLAPATSQQCNTTYLGTTRNFEEIFLGRCYYFLNVLHGRDCKIHSLNINCTALLDAFSAAVINKAACDIKIDDFNEFLKLANHPLGVNTTLFWSGTYNPAHARTINYFVD
jgi:hypothetical protein